MPPDPQRNARLQAKINFPISGKRGFVLLLVNTPEQTHDFRQSVDRLFSHESVARIELTISEVKVACFDECVTEGEALCMFRGVSLHEFHTSH
jgi:hypothetical protein